MQHASFFVLYLYSQPRISNIILPILILSLYLLRCDILFNPSSFLIFFVTDLSEPSLNFLCGSMEFYCSRFQLKNISESNAVQKLHLLRCWSHTEILVKMVVDSTLEVFLFDVLEFSKLDAHFVLLGSKKSLLVWEGCALELDY